MNAHSGSQRLRICLELPAWVEEELPAEDEPLATVEERLAFAIRLSSRNVDEGTGGPFGAAVFEIDSGRFVAAGVNIVVPTNCSVAHAESMALVLAQQRLGTYDLGAEGLPALELVSSSQPCIQCFGNVWWSGVRRLVIGARGDDVERIAGFDEGPLPADWVDLLENRPAPLGPVRVVRDLLVDEAREVLRRYKEKGGPIYNAGSG